MLVDNAVVVLESIERLRQAGRGKMRSALEGAREVLPAVVSATATSAIVFLPLLLGGRTEITTWIGEVERTVIFALACSLLLSITAIPLAMGRFLPSGEAPSSRAVNWLATRHQQVLAWTLAHRPMTLLIAFLVVASAVFPFSKIDKSTFSGSKVERVNIEYRFTDNLNYRETERYVARLEDWILARKDSLRVKSTYSYYGNNEPFTRAYLAKGWADDEGAQKVRKLLRAGLPDLPGVVLTLGGDDESQGASRVGVRLFGDPGPRLDQISEDVRRRLSRVPGLTDVTIGGRVPLVALAEFKHVETPASIQRQQRRSVTLIEGNSTASQGGEVRKAVTRELSAMSFPVGYSWSFGEGFEEESQTQQEMLVNLVLALMLVYFVMAALFESLLHPFAIMLALPFAFVGIAWTSFLTKSPFNLMAQIGLLILIGIVVNDGIVLIYKVHQLRQRGVARREALLQGARDRLRPILMTTATTVLGLLPLAIGGNHVGGILYYPLARTVMGGLLASTLLTLVLVPCLYTLLEDSTRFVAHVWKMGPKAA